MERLDGETLRARLQGTASRAAPRWAEARLGFQISHGIHPDAVSQFLEGGDESV